MEMNCVYMMILTSAFSPIQFSICDLGQELADNDEHI